MKLRAWNIADVKSLAHFANNEAIASMVKDQFPHPYTEENAVFFLENIAIPAEGKIFAIEVDGQAIGGIGIHLQDDVYRKNAELGYWIGEEYWGRGIATKAIKQIVDYGFNQFDIVRIFAGVFATNIGSIKALEKVGFIKEATLKDTVFKRGKFLDEHIYAIRKTEI